MTVPVQFYESFGVNADPSTINAIPDTTGTPGAASFQEGFPLLTMEAPASGGIPPFGQDMNGILQQITDVVRFLNTGMAFPYSSAFSTLISGYPAGAIVMSDRTDQPGTGFWLNTVAGNTTDPDAGGAGWVPINNYGHTTIALTNTDVTLTADQYARGLIILTGTLTGNVNVIFPALDGEQWLIVNTTGGAFTTSAKCAGGTALIIAQGSHANPTGVYCDGANIFNSNTPLTVPTDVAPTPTTLAERDTSGNLNAVSFNSDIGTSVPTIGAVAVQNNALDGYIRFITKANFLAQMFPVDTTNKQVTIGGFIIKWGTFTSINGSVSVVFSAGGFPTACAGVSVLPLGVTGAGFAAGAPSKTGFTYTNGTTTNMQYMAFGY